MSANYYSFELPPADEIEPTLAACNAWVASLLAGLGRHRDLWLFAYGSLMWHPDIPLSERRRATAHGYHRDFCVYSYHYRGTSESPGLVLGLDRGGACRGVALRVPRAEAEPVAHYLWRREMVAHAYRPAQLRVAVGRRRLHALTFVADRSHRQYAGALGFDEKAAIIASAAGYRGSNFDYLTATLERLEALGITDRRLAAYRRAALLRAGRDARGDRF